MQLAKAGMTAVTASALSSTNIFSEKPAAELGLPDLSQCRIYGG
tara:strand:- start:425 stop:556 length:132 start_codon:yes stop_codon:yes gene_type:complete